MVIPFNCHLRSLGLDGFINNFGPANNLAYTFALNAVSVIEVRKSAEQRMVSLSTNLVGYSCLCFSVAWSGAI